MAEKLGLYIHIPFCRSKCDYCDFYSLSGRETRMDDYQKALLVHMGETAPQARSYSVDTVYFGGGTPSFYGEKRLRALLKSIGKRFELAKDAEITVECNPDSVDKQMLTQLRRAGFNRISLGVQSACDRELAQLHRPHTFAQAQEAAAAARAAKFKNLSLDLIYGLPGQDMAGWQDTVEQALALEPEHLSCYGLKVEEGTPLWEMQGRLEMPDDDLQADMYLWCVERLAQLGYAQYEISNFAKPGCESRHNLKYWTLGEYAGFGPGAHSDLGGVRYAYVRDLSAYCWGVEAGSSVVESSETIPPRERDMEYIMLGLRTAQGISGKEFEYRCRRPFAPVEAVLRQFVRTGHTLRREGRWRLTPEGFLVSNQIIGQALEALADEKLRREQAAARHDYRMV